MPNDVIDRVCPHCGRPTSTDQVKAIADPQLLIHDHSFISDLARFSEDILDEAAVRKRWRLEESDWLALGENDELVRVVEEEKVRRIRSGTTKRERAQIEVVDAPPILGKILKDPAANERHRIDAAKALDALAGGPEAAPISERFQITIVLSADEKLVIDKPIRPGPDDNDRTIGITPQAVIPDKSGWRE
jgi:hypothetical protein